MAELKRIEEELPTAKLASDGIPPKQPDGPKLVKGQEPESLNRAAAVSEPMPLFSEPEMGDFRSQWSKLQTGFVDERSALEKQWDRADNVSTEDLRVALQRYRSFFDRLLKL